MLKFEPRRLHVSSSTFPFNNEATNTVYSPTISLDTITMSHHLFIGTASGPGFGVGARNELGRVET